MRAWRSAWGLDGLIDVGNLGVPGYKCSGRPVSAEHLVSVVPVVDRPSQASLRDYDNMKSSVLVGAFATGAFAQSGAWQQCGGTGFQGSTSCVAGYHCAYLNEWYSQCTPGAESATLKTSTTAAVPSSTTSAAPGSTSSSSPGSGSGSGGKLKWLGINQSCAEFGQGTYPGTWGKEFTFPSASSIEVITKAIMSSRGGH